MEKTGFKSIFKAPKDQKSGKWHAPTIPYDDRSAPSVSVGSYAGIGEKNPVGSLKPTKGNAIPFGRVKTMELNEDYKVRTSKK